MSNARLVAPYKKGATAPTVIFEESGNHFLFLEKNIDVTTEFEFIDTKQIEKFYGSAEISKFVLIRQED